MKTLAVRFEGTISRCTPYEASNLEFGEVRPEAIDALKELSEFYEIIVVSSAAGSSRGLQLLTSFLQDHEVPYTDVWSGFNLPVFNYLLDDVSYELSDKAIKLLAKAGKVEFNG